jgi:hypothetical protein
MAGYPSMGVDLCRDICAGMESDLRL